MYLKGLATVEISSYKRLRDGRVELKNAGNVIINDIAIADKRYPKT